MSNIVLINAAGIGVRFNSETPKQYYLINKKPILYYSLKLFQENDLVDEIYIIAQREYFEIIEEICRNFNIHKFKQCIQGGKSANESRYNGLMGIKCCPNDFIIMHDAVRICIKDSTISKLIEMGNEYGYGVCGQTLNANIFTPNIDDSVIDDNIPSKNIFLNSMPFICKYKILIEAFNNGIDDLDITAGPMGILSRFGDIKVFPKIEIDFIETFKITYKEDINFVEKIIKLV